MLRVQLTSTPAMSEPFGEVIHQYTDTLCTTQKQTNLTNALLQDIAIFNGHNPTKLEEWLTDLETAADLTNESCAKLAKAKSRGLTCTLVTEAINSEKHGMKSRTSLGSNCVIPTFTHTPHTSLRYNSVRMSPWQLMFTSLEQKASNVISQMMLPLSRFLLKD